MEKQPLDGNDVFLIHRFLSDAECKHYIALSEAVGYRDAPITTAAGPLMRKDIRDNTRVMADDPVLAALLWNRARPFLPPMLLNWEAIGFNERLRYYRYDIGERFAPHYDGAFERAIDEKSKLTFMIYLNDGFVGGETNFYRGGIERPPWLSVEPEIGAALVFVHHKLHEGSEVRQGRKYVLRTDVMYRRKRPSPQDGSTHTPREVKT